MAKKFLDSAGLSTFLDSLKLAYSSNNTETYSTFGVAQAAQAEKLKTARTIKLEGAVSGQVDFDGSASVTISTSVAGEHITNVIETVKVNGTPLTPDANKAVNVVIPAATVTDVKTKLISDGSYTTALNGTVAEIDLSVYAKKSEITTVMRFCGTKTSDGLAALTGMSTGDVYSIVSGGTGTTYKVNSEYAYNGSDWVELGPVIDLSGYVEKTQTINDKTLSGNITLNGSDIALSTTYAIATTAAAPAASDSIDVAVGKLQKEIADNTTAIGTLQSAATTYAFAEGSTTGAFQVTPTVGGTTGSAQSISIHGLGSAAYTESSAYVSSTLAPAEAGAQVNVIETVKVNGSALTVTNKAVDVTVPVIGVQVKAHGADDYTTAVDANKVAKIDLSGLATLSDISSTISSTGDYVTGVSYSNGVISVAKTAKGSIADNSTGLVDGDTVYDYIEGMAMTTADVNALFPSNS